MRLKKIQASLTVEILLIDNPVDLYYLTGLDLSKGRLAIGKKEAYLFVDGRYFEMAKKKAPCPVILTEAGALEEKLKPFRQIGFDSAFVSVDGYQALQKELLHKNWQAIASPLRDFRVIKEEAEIAKLRRAADVTWKGYKHAASCLKEGITETEIAWEFERFCREHGASELSFSSIIAFVENGAYPHYRAGNVKLKKDMAVLIDVGAVVDHYAGDLTRVVFFGKPDPEIEKMYRWVQSAQKKAVDAVKPGIPIGDLDWMVREIFKKEGVDSFFTHNLGHGIGLETHEYPRIRHQTSDGGCILKPNMVFTIEPGLYRPGIGGVRYEDMVVVTETGVENLYPC